MDPNLVPLIGVVLGAGGIAGAIVAIVKLKPEAGQIIVKSAEGAVIVQAGVIDDLTDELERVNARLAEVEATSVAAAQRTKQLESENAFLKLRVSTLETENIELREQVSILQDIQNGHG